MGNISASRTDYIAEQEVRFYWQDRRTGDFRFVPLYRRTEGCTWEGRTVYALK